MKAARAERPGNPRHDAGLAWRAMLLEILLTIPLRLGDIQRLRFDQHLHREDPRGGPVTTIKIPPDQTKNDREVNAPVAPPLAAMLATWTSTFRPLIADPVCGFLFPGQGTGDKPLSPQSMRDAVKQVTGQYVGVTLSPHQFRHLAAERFLRDNPGQYEELRRLLNHATVETTIRAYARKEQGAALQRYDDIITEQRSRLRSKRKPATKPQRGRRDA
jgi:integrase